MEILFIRHGYSTGNDKKIMCGHTDADLTATGVKQGEAVSRYIYENYTVKRIFVTGLKRTYQTVKLLCDKTGITPEIIPEFNEINCGEWEGKTIDEIKRIFPIEYQAYITNPVTMAMPNGESFTGFIDRVEKGLKVLAEKLSGETGTAVVCAHGGVFRMIEGLISGIDKNLFNTIPLVNNVSVTKVILQNGKYRLAERNYDAFLEESMRTEIFQGV